jgi:hypothetical protein
MISLFFSRTFEEHLSRLQTVFSRIKEAGLKISPQKCFLFHREVKFLGHIVNSSGILPDPSKIEAISTWPSPTSLKELRSFLGTRSYYRKFIQDFSKIARPLHHLTEKNTLYRWTSDCQEAFDCLKRTLTKVPFWYILLWRKNFYWIQMPVVLG